MNLREIKDYSRRRYSMRDFLESRRCALRAECTEALHTAQLSICFHWCAKRLRQMSAVSQGKAGSIPGHSM